MSYGDPADLTRLCEKYINLSEKEDVKGIYNHRRLYWKGTALFMNGDFEKGDSLRREALAQCDSTLFPRDFRMYRMAVEQTSDFHDNLSRYQRYSSDLNVFLQNGDLVSGFTRAVQLSNLMTEAGMHSTAMKFVFMADSLLEKANLPILRANNRVNLASCQFLAGDTISALTTLRELSRSPEASSIPSIKAIIEFNIHQMSGDTVALRKAWNIVKEDDNLLRMKPLVAAAMVKERMFPQNLKGTETAAEILSLAEDYAYSPEDLLYLAEAECNLALQSNDTRHLPRLIKKYQDAVKEYREELKRNELIGAETSRQISEAEHKVEVERLQNQRRLWISISVLLLIAVLVAFLIFRYINRLKRLKLLQQLESERLRRSKLSLELTLAEKEVLISGLQDKINNMVKHEVLPEKTAIELGKVLEEESRLTDTERETEFMRQFMLKFPKVGKTGRRFALFIRRGMDTSQIATTMNIRKESVIQGRWRLRNQMQLKGDEDLDITIRTLH